MYVKVISKATQMQFQGDPGGNFKIFPCVFKSHGPLKINLLKVREAFSKESVSFLQLLFFCITDSEKSYVSPTVSWEFLVPAGFPRAAAGMPAAEAVGLLPAEAAGLPSAVAGLPSSAAAGLLPATGLSRSAELPTPPLQDCQHQQQQDCHQQKDCHQQEQDYLQQQQHD